MITLCYPSSIWGTKPAPILFHCPISHTPYDMFVLTLVFIATVTMPVPVLFHCLISHTPYYMLVLTLVSIILVTPLFPMAPDTTPDHTASFPTLPI